MVHSGDICASSKLTVSRKIIFEVDAELTYTQFAKSSSEVVDILSKGNIIQKKSIKHKEKIGIDLTLQSYKDMFGMEYQYDSTSKKVTVNFKDYLKVQLFYSLLEWDIPFTKHYELWFGLTGVIQECYYISDGSKLHDINWLKGKINSNDDLLYAYFHYIKNNNQDITTQIDGNCGKNINNNFFIKELGYESFLSNIRFERKKLDTKFLEYIIELSFNYSEDIFLISTDKIYNHIFYIIDEGKIKDWLKTGCSIFNLSNLIRKTVIDIFEKTELEKYNISSKENPASWKKVLEDIQDAVKMLGTFEFTLKSQDKKPMFGTVSFVHKDLKKYDVLKDYTGKFGFVAPTHGRNDKKVLKGQKSFKYKKKSGKK